MCKRSISHLFYLAAGGVIVLLAQPADALVRLGDLGPLEVKFFAHQYDRETPSERLARLEKLVFGTTQSGSIEQRVDKLSATVNGATIATAGQSSRDAKGADASTNTVASKTNPKPVADSYDYPKVAQLEQAILGKTFKGEPVKQRLNRLETKAYGAPSQSSDMALRVDKLSNYADVFGMQPGDEQTALSHAWRGQTEISNSSSRSQSHGMLDRVSALESKVLGRPTSNQALVERIRILEHQVFGKSASANNEDMTARVDKLWASVKPESLDYAQPFANQTAQTMAPFSPNTASQPFQNYGQSNFISSTPNANQLPYFASSKQKHKGKTGAQSSHSSLIGKLGKVMVFAGSAAVGASGVAVSALGSMNTGYYGGGLSTRYGASAYPYYSPYSPGYGTVSSISSFGTSGGFMGSPFNSSYAGSFFSH